MTSSTSFSRLKFYEFDRPHRIEAVTFFDNGYGAKVYTNRVGSEAGMYMVIALMAFEPRPKGIIGKDSLELKPHDLPGPIENMIQGLHDREEVEQILEEIASLLPLEFKKKRYPRWTQVGGDVNPEDHGAVLARDEGLNWVEIVAIEPDEGREGWYLVTERTFHYSELAWDMRQAQDAARSAGVSEEEWERGFDDAGRAELIVGYSGGRTRRVGSWRAALPVPEDQIEWWR